jgi:hypothetical protein
VLKNVMLEFGSSTDREPQKHGQIWLESTSDRNAGKNPNAEQEPELSQCHMAAHWVSHLDQY